jgi:hypothetical protein
LNHNNNPPQRTAEKFVCRDEDNAYVFMLEFCRDKAYHSEFEGDDSDTDVENSSDLQEIVDKINELSIAEKKKLRTLILL